MNWWAPENFFDLERLAGSRAASLFTGLAHVWEALDLLEPFIKETLRGNVAELRAEGDFLVRPAAICGGRVYRDITYELGDPARGKLVVRHQGEVLPRASLIMAGVSLTSDDIEIGEGALIESGAMIKGPSIIGPNSEVRQGAYVRGAVMSSQGAVIGHNTEAKNTLLLADAKAGHFAYLGDSILGREVNLGAGTKLANLKMNDLPYYFKYENERFKVERRKFGAIIGDQVETGCNTVTSPGALVGRSVKVLPNTTVGPGYHPAGSFLGRR